MAISDSQRLMAKRVLANTSGKLLRRGSRGVSVRALQAFLADKGYDVGKLDGVFGKQTQKALKAFQKASGARVDGKAGSETFGKVREQMPDVAEPVASLDVAPMEAMEPIVEPSIPPEPPVAPVAEFTPPEQSADDWLNAKGAEMGVAPPDNLPFPPMTGAGMPPPPAPSPEEAAAQSLSDQMPVPAETAMGAGETFQPVEGARPFDPSGRTFPSATAPDTRPGMDALRQALLGKVGPQQAQSQPQMPPQNQMAMNDLIRALTMGMR